MTIVDDPRLLQLAQYTPEQELTHGYGDHYLFFVGRDDVHGIYQSYVQPSYQLTHEQQDAPVSRQISANKQKPPLHYIHVTSLIVPALSPGQ